MWCEISLSNKREDVSVMEKVKKPKVIPLLQVYSASCGAMATWIKTGAHSGSDNIFYSANGLRPLVDTLRVIHSLEDIDRLKEELLAHADNINGVIPE